MTILKARIHYVNKSPKTNRYIDNIIPQEDREVSEKMFKCYEEKHGTEKPDDDRTMQDGFS